MDQTGVTGGNTVAEKRLDFAYMRAKAAILRGDIQPKRGQQATAKESTGETPVATYAVSRSNCRENSRSGSRQTSDDWMTVGIPANSATKNG